MRGNQPDYKLGDLIPIRSSMNNEIWCEILEDDWVVSNSGDVQKKTMLLSEKALLVYADEITYRDNSKLDTLMLDTGPERHGKSMFVYGKKKLYESPFYQDKDKLKDIISTDNWNIKTFTNEHKDFDLDSITFKLEKYQNQLVKALTNSKKIFTLDEAGAGLSSLNWWDTDQQDLYVEFQIIGKKQLKSDLVLPHLKDLNNRFRNRRVAIWSHITGRKNESQCKLERGFVEIRNSIPSKWELDTYWEPWIVCKFPDLSEDNDWIKYEDKKDKYIQEFAEELKLKREFEKMGGKGNKYFMDACTLIKEMCNPKLHIENEQYSYIEIAKLLGLNNKSITSRMSKFENINNYKAQLEARLKDLKSDDDETGDD